MLATIKSITNVGHNQIYHKINWSQSNRSQKKLVTIKLITKNLVTFRLKIDFGPKENSSFDGDFSGQNFISANY